MHQFRSRKDEKNHGIGSQSLILQLLKWTSISALRITICISSSQVIEEYKGNPIKMTELLNPSNDCFWSSLGNKPQTRVHTFAFLHPPMSRSSISNFKCSKFHVTSSWFHNLIRRFGWDHNKMQNKWKSYEIGFDYTMTIVHFTQGQSSGSLNKTYWQE